jgi:hypothetical protein
MARTPKRCWNAALTEAGRPIPPPSDELNYSGKRQHSD